MKTADRNAAFQELCALVATYLEGSDDADRAAELLDALKPSSQSTPSAVRDETASARETREKREYGMFGCTAAAIDKALSNKEPRDVAMYAMGILSDAQELIELGEKGWTVKGHNVNHLRQLINVAKYAIDKAVPRG